MTHKSVTLVDFSQTVHAAANAQFDGVFQRDNEDSKNLAKHFVLNTLLGLKRRFGGNMILCCDGKNYWRKTEFPWYKGHRVHHRDKNSKFDWGYFCEVLAEIKVDLVENFTYKLLEIDGAEADDIIGVLTKYYQENELVESGLIETPIDITIVSTDGDLPQLQKYRNVRQWNNVTKKFVVAKNPNQWLVEHIVSGDNGDNIPSVCNDDSWAQMRADNIPTRAAPFKSARMVEFHKKYIDACLSEKERINYKRNEKLIDLDFIPEDISNRIIKEYINYEVIGSKTKILHYLMKNKMRVLLRSAAEF